MIRSRRQPTPEFKQDAVTLVRRSGQSTNRVAKNRWKVHYGLNIKIAFSDEIVVGGASTLLKWSHVINHRVISGAKKVYRVDDHGNKTQVYETDQNRQKTIHDAQASMAKRQVAAQEMAEQIRASKAEQLEVFGGHPQRQRTIRFMRAWQLVSNQ